MFIVLCITAITIIVIITIILLRIGIIVVATIVFTTIISLNQQTLYHSKQDTANPCLELLALHASTRPNLRLQSAKPYIPTPILLGDSRVRANRLHPQSLYT